MRTSPQSYHTLLGIAPCKKGFGFAVIEARGLLVSWGVARLYSWHDDEFLQRVQVLIDKYNVGLVCLEDISAQSRLGDRARRLIKLASQAAARSKVRYSHISRNDAAQQLGLAKTARKYEIALRLVNLYPELDNVLPPPRRPWQTEDARMALFIAAALSVVHLALPNVCP